MTDERVEEVLFDINGKLSSISTKLDSMSENILKHESRLTNLENTLNNHLTEVSLNKSKENEDFKVLMLKLLGKCLIIGLTTIASLSGAGALLSKIIAGA